MMRRTPRSTRTDTLFPSRRSSDLFFGYVAALAGFSLFVRRKVLFPKLGITNGVDKLLELVALILISIGIINFIYNVVVLHGGDVISYYQDRMSTRLNYSH